VLLSGDTCNSRVILNCTVNSPVFFISSKMATVPCFSCLIELSKYEVSLKGILTKWLIIFTRNNIINSIFNDSILYSRIFGASDRNKFENK
jgi:hypothetical protein